MERPNPRARYVQSEKQLAKQLLVLVRTAAVLVAWGAASEIPMSPMVVNALKEWRLACPWGDLGLVFPNGAGNVENHANSANRCWCALQSRRASSIRRAEPNMASTT